MFLVTVFVSHTNTRYLKSIIEKGGIIAMIKILVLIVYQDKTYLIALYNFNERNISVLRINLFL